MPNSNKKNDPSSVFSRRNFLKAGGAAVAVGALPLASGCATKKAEIVTAQDPATSKVRGYRRLGRTEFEASDVSFGGVPQTSDVIRYCYDKGINYFDTAESYGNGSSERLIGEAMQHMDRSKIFITTKMHFPPETTKEQLLERFAAQLERMQTDYADALYIHNVDSVELMNHAGFHAACDQLKAEGRLRHVGVSYHGPSGDRGEPMGDVLCAAAADGRFDLMLLVYNHIAAEEGQRILEACRKHDVGTTLMKTSPGALDIEPLDTENLPEDYQEWLDAMIERGMERDAAIARMVSYNNDQLAEAEQVKPFVAKHGVTTNLQLRQLSMQWALANPLVQSVCISLTDFESVDNFVARSGMRLASAERRLLDDYRLAFSSRYCRHGCNECVGACPERLPVSTIMRYSYYFSLQGREKLAMQKYASLDGRRASVCLDCDAPCDGACPHGVNVRSAVLGAHRLLTIA